MYETTLMREEVKTKITRLKPRLKGALTFTFNENEDQNVLS